MGKKKGDGISSIPGKRNAAEGITGPKMQTTQELASQKADNSLKKSSMRIKTEGKVGRENPSLKH